MQKVTRHFELIMPGCDFVLAYILLRRLLSGQPFQSTCKTTSELQQVAWAFILYMNYQDRAMHTDLLEK